MCKSLFLYFNQHSKAMILDQEFKPRDLWFYSIKTQLIALITRNSENM